MGKTMPVPDLDALGDFALAAARNARRLLGDAEVLFKHGRWPSAYSLAVLAFEEAGKAWMCVITMMLPDDVRPEWPFGDGMAKHVDKLMAALAMAHLFASASGGQDVIASLAEVSEGLEELAREHDKAKQRGFYTDLLDGVLQEPTRITQNEARRMVDTVRNLLRHGGLLADPEFVAWLASQDPDALRAKEVLWGALATGLQQGTPEGMFTSLHSFYDEIGATEGFPQMVREQAAIADAREPRRVQPRRRPRSQRRTHR
jgi:AbiV family abortive infection protein